MLAPLSDGNVLKRGDVLRIETGGGGGHGHPFDRPPEMLAETCSAASSRREAAQRLYGVVLSGGAVDQAATAGCAPTGRRPRHSTARSMSIALADTSLAVAVDIGGTFTDIALHDATSGQVWRAKTPSVPPDPCQAFLTGMRLALDDAGRAATTLGRVLHGTTVATNMILEGKGARTALVTTKGFRHVLAIGRQDIPRARQLSRLGEAGAPGAGLARARDRASASAPAARCSRRSTRRACRPPPRPAAPRRSRRSRSACCIPSPTPRTSGAWPSILRAELPGIAVTASTDVLPVVREYERSLATVLNAAGHAGRRDLRVAAGRAPGRARRSRRRCC